MARMSNKEKARRAKLSRIGRKVKAFRQKCERCGYRWKSALKRPRFCSRCKSKAWMKKLGEGKKVTIRRTWDTSQVGVRVPGGVLRRGRLQRLGKKAA